ncbi:MAG: DAK2 domain-containing protein [Eubacteriales bacterium]|nr:DAK2 domain-containing protein [Eubacteriales bacterium]
MLNINTIDGVLLRDMLVAGTTMLLNNREKVDSLNVFPVPDGDTGTNMFLTIQSAMKEVTAKECATASEAAQAIAKGALRGARGNSGVILSQLFRGFAKELLEVEKITPTQFAMALHRGARTAYKAVMKPKEGTILTVARVIAEEAIKQAEQTPDDFNALFDNILTTGDDILKKTQQMLPVLKQAGVVDSGGCGLLYIYIGFAAALRGEDLPQNSDIATSAASYEDIIESYNDLENKPFAYRVESKIIHIKATTKAEDIDSFKRRLNQIGDYNFVEQNDTEIRVLAHVKDPSKVLKYSLELGEIDEVRVSNLLSSTTIEAVPVELKKYGMVAVSLGEGFSSIFKDLQVDKIVDGGQTMNPSIDDLSSAIEAVHAENVFVFPNNGNIILAAEQAAKISNKTVKVLPTKNVAMGISAAIAFNPDTEVEQNYTKMMEAAERVRTGMVTYAVRDTVFEELEIKKGDIIGLSNGKVSIKGQDIFEVASNMMKDIVTEDDELISVYFGSDVQEEDAQKVADFLADAYPDCDVELQNGGQPLYYYLISVE